MQTPLFFFLVISLIFFQLQHLSLSHGREIKVKKPQEKKGSSDWNWVQASIAPGAGIIVRITFE